MPLFFINNIMGGIMNKKIISRVIDEGNYIIKTGKTVREMAKVFQLSKSTIHIDVTIRNEKEI